MDTEFISSFSSDGGSRLLWGRASLQHSSSSPAAGGSDGKESLLPRRRPKLHPWVSRMPWRRAWKPTPVFFPGKSQGQRSLVGYSPRGHKKLDVTEQLSTHVLGQRDGSFLPQRMLPKQSREWVQCKWPSRWENPASPGRQCRKVTALTVPYCSLTEGTVLNGTCATVLGSLVASFRRLSSLSPFSSYQCQGAL